MNLRPFFTLLLTLSLALVHSSQARPGVEAGRVRAEVRALVRVAAESVAQGERLTLGDVASINSSDGATAERLRAVSLGYAPNVGAVRELTREKIQLSIAAAGFSADSVSLQAPRVAIVKRASQRIAPETLRAAIERVALAELQSPDVTAQLTRLDLPSSIELPSGVVEARAYMGKVKDYFAPFPVSIELLVDGRVMRRLTTTVQIEAQAMVLVAARNLDARLRLREGDVRLEMRRLERSASLYVRDPARLRGASLARALMSGEPLMTDAMFADIVIKAGDPLRIIGEAGSLSLNVAGEARASGRVGERIQVRNLQSGVLLQATVIDEGLVRVRF
jgi:flagella basal body P-ring formation protein FlgA